MSKQSSETPVVPSDEQMETLVDADTSDLSETISSTETDSSGRLQTIIENYKQITDSSVSPSTAKIIGAESYTDNSITIRFSYNGETKLATFTDSTEESPNTIEQLFAETQCDTFSELWGEELLVYPFANTDDFERKLHCTESGLRGKLSTVIKYLFKLNILAVPTQDHPRYTHSRKVVITPLGAILSTIITAVSCFLAVVSATTLLSTSPSSPILYLVLSITMLVSIITAVTSMVSTLEGKDLMKQLISGDDR